MTVDHILPHSLDDIYGPGAEDASYIPETTYTVRVDDGRVVEMTGMQADLDKILAAMRAHEHKPLSAVDLLLMLHPWGAGKVIKQARSKARWMGKEDAMEALISECKQHFAKDDEEGHAFDLAIQDDSPDEIFQMMLSAAFGPPNESEEDPT